MTCRLSSDPEREEVRNGRQRVVGLDDAVEVAVSSEGLACARRANGHLACWGRKVDGVLTASQFADAPRTYRLDDLIARAR